jgi:predicted CoA-binding protein
MDLKEIMQYKNYVVVGNTINEEKYAYKIKNKLIEAGYNVRCVGKELSSINDVEFRIDVLDLCINPNLGIALLKENKKEIKVVVIQPGAESIEIKEFLEQNKIEYLEACLLVGISLYRK